LNFRFRFSLTSQKKEFFSQVYKNVDWRWILSGVGAVAGFYCFERLRWDNGAKEERLKSQFRQHLEQRLFLKN